MINNIIKELARSNTSIIKNQAVVYNFKNNAQNKYQQNKNNIFLLLKYFFASFSCLISKPFWTISPNRITLHLFFYSPLSNNNLFNKKRFNKKLKNRFRLRNRKF